MKKQVSVLTLIISCIMVFVATLAIQKSEKNSPISVQTAVANDCPNTMDQIRLKNFEHIQPLVLANVSTQSTALQNIRTKIEQYVNDLKANQKIDEVSVYFRKMNDGSWFCINPNTTYNPASMSKIIYLITYLKEAEYNQGIFSKKIYFARHYAEGNQQNIKNFSLKENMNYTVRDLLTYMIVYSDNDATLLLSQNMNLSIYKQLFIDLDIPNPPTVGEYYITATDYSKFFRVLYNASYIRPEFSEYGMKLLTMSTYKSGLSSGVDSTIQIAHKFGERVIGDKAQLHEFGIVYVKGSPYMVGVFTKGRTLSQLTGVISDISKISFEEYKNNIHL